MISVGSRDGRKGLEQGFVSNKRDMDMDETELEEGEACSFQDDDTSIDLDVALSHIDEKLQNVLGHFKKDFEGVVSAESLGAKYGIYGSFLPAYRRSPVWGHSKSPPRVQNHNTSHSPNTIQGGQHNSVAQLNNPHSVKHGSASASASASSYINKPPSQSDTFRQNLRTQSMQSVDENTPKSEVRDQRTLKVRIKVGSDSLSGKKNAAIYSVVGLEDSPSSFVDSPNPMDGEGLPFDAYDSPLQILQMMTSFPVFGGCLLSPLSEYHVQLSEGQDILTQNSPKVNPENSVFGHISQFVKDSKTFSGENSMKLLDKKGLSLQVKRDIQETDIDSVSCEEIVSNALKLPLLSDSYTTMGDPLGASQKEKVHFEVPRKESLESISIPVSSSEKPNGKANLAGKSVDNAANDMMTDSRKIGDCKGEMASSSTSTDKVSSQFEKASKSRIKDPVKQRAYKSTSAEDSIVLSHEKEKFSGDKKKPKKSHVRGFAPSKVVLETSQNGAQVSKGQNCNDSENLAFKSEFENSPRQKDLNKSRDKYMDFFGDTNEEEGDVIMDSPHVPSSNRMKTSELGEQTTLAYENNSSEKASSLETCKRAISGTHLKGSSQNASLLENGRPISDPTSTGVDTDDNWVCCDKCQKWRLLPPGSKVDSLPEKWLCSMLTWLPDMNSCNISEDETTKALRARYQLLAENPNRLHVPPDKLTTGMTSGDVLKASVPNDGKMINKLRKTSKSLFQDSPNQLPSSIKNKQQSAKDKTLTEAKEPSLMNELDFPPVTKSTDAYMETNQHKETDKQRADYYSDGGHAKISKIKNIREHDQEFPRISKKSKTRSIQSEDNDKAAVHYHNAEKDQMANPDFFYSSNSKHDMDGNLPDTFAKSKSQVEESHGVASLHVRKSDSGTITPKKRKADNLKDAPCSTPSSSKLISDDEQSSRKKHKISKSEGKESSGSKRSGKIDKKSRSISQHSLDNSVSLQKATTSSSSKVSGSLRGKSKGQEVKSSPVESVSSSPQRISNLDKLTSGSKIIVDKDNVQEAVKLETGSPRKWSDVDYERGSARSVSIMKDVIEVGSHRKSVEPSMIDLQKKSNGGLHHKNGLPQICTPNLEYGLSTDNGCADNLDLDNGYPSEAQTSDRCVNNATKGEGNLNINISHSGKCSTDSSVLCKDKTQTCKSNSDKGKVKMSNSYDNPQDHTPVYEGKERDRKRKVQEKFVSDVDKPENHTISKNQEASILKPKGQQDGDEKRSSKKIDAEKSDNLVSTSRREKSWHLPPSDREKSNGVSNSSTDAHSSDGPKEPGPSKKEDSQNGAHHIPSRTPISNGHRVKNPDAPSPRRRDSSSLAASSALKEAKNLKHLADRLKSGGSTESTGYYFEAALKFLHGASLLEAGKTENAKQGDLIQSMQIYSSTAKLCAFCAHEYEKSKDMATAALAYKCMEVAYLRVIYSSHNTASRDRHELQTVLQMLPPGESPSSSASDIDNLNNTATGDKAAQGRSGGSPQLASNLVIAARNRPNFSRLLNYAQDVNFAMEASRKSRIAFAAADVSMEKGHSKDGIASIKRALDFNFHDVEGLLRLVRLAKEATSR